MHFSLRLGMTVGLVCETSRLCLFIFKFEATLPTRLSYIHIPTLPLGARLLSPLNTIVGC